MNSSIPFIDLAAQRRRFGKDIDAAVLRVMDHGGYIMGPEVKVLEEDLAAFCGARHVVSCANGTDAIGMVLIAKGLGPGQAEVPGLQRQGAGGGAAARHHLVDPVHAL